MGFQVRPVAKAGFACDDQLRIVQGERVRIGGASSNDAAEGLCIAASNAVQQGTSAFALVFEVEPGQSILLLCLCPQQAERGCHS